MSGYIQQSEVVANYKTKKKEQGQIDNNAIDCLHSNRSANHKWISVVRDCQVRGLNATIYPAAYHA